MDGDANGLTGDLKTATSAVPAAVNEYGIATSWTDTGTYYYRYYIDDSTGHGFAHGLKMAFSPQEYQNVINCGVDPTAISDSYSFWDPTAGAWHSIAYYSSEYYEYNTSRQVTTAAIGGAYTYTYAYTPNTPSTDYNAWNEETVETRLDGSAVHGLYELPWRGARDRLGGFVGQPLGHEERVRRQWV